MSERRIDRQTIRRICRIYDIGEELLSVQRAGGTAGMNTRIRTQGGEFFLRSRATEHAQTQYILYDHKLLVELGRCDLPVTPPLTSKDGATFVRLGAKVFELFKWVDGRQFEQGNRRQMTDLGRQIARLHQITADMTQHKDKPWEQNPMYLLGELEALTKNTRRDEKPELLERIRAELVELAGNLCADVRGQLPQAIVHGDLHPGNALFAANRLVGLFDWDWANRQMRITDICDAIFFFARRSPSEFSGLDIWLLTCSFRTDGAQASVFLDAYEALSPLTSTERELLSEFLAARWLQERIRGMRKVPVEQRLGFLDRGGDLFGVLEHLKNFAIPQSS